MSCFKLPKGLCQDIEALIQRFFWGQRGENRKIHWVKWRDLCKPKSQGGMGFKDLSMYNDAMLAKQAWRLLHDTNSLLYRVFKPKFFLNCSIMEAKVPNSAPHAWKSIIKGRKVIRKGGLWRIGDGRSINFWTDNWVPLKYKPKLISPVQNQNTSTKVCEFICQETQTWKVEKLDSCLLEFEAAVVKKIPLCHTQQRDIITWPFTADGEYTVKSGYQFLMNELYKADSGPSSIAAAKELWHVVWHLQVPNKVKNLVWRACRNSLPTKMNLVRRKIITDSTCDLCQTSQEDVQHALYLCPKLTELWQSVPLYYYSKLKQCANFLDLLECIFADNRDPRLFSMVVWALWNRRNNIHLAKGAIALGQLLQQAQERLQEFSVQQPSTLPTRNNVAVSWQPPARSWYKVNFDGALFEKDQCAGIGVVIQNDQGLVMASLSQRIPLPFTVIEI